MCGRYALGKLQWWILQETFKLQQAAGNMPPRWNIAPTQSAPIIRRGEKANELVMSRWGLIPYFWKKPVKAMKYSTFNAKSETAPTSPSFREPFARRRCVVPAAGFYEWTGAKGAKQPWWITMKDQDWFGFAGLWDRAEVDGETGPETLESFTILTTKPNMQMSAIHTRMPVFLDPADFEAWMDPATQNVESLIKPLPEGVLDIREANKAVGNVRVDEEWLTEPGDGLQARLV